MLKLAKKLIFLFDFPYPKSDSMPITPLFTRTCVILISATESHRSHIKKEKFSRRFLLTRETLIPALNFTTTSF